MFKFLNTQAQLKEERKKNAVLTERQIAMEEQIAEQEDALIELASIIAGTDGEED